jgi:outer membrane protein TolC
VLSSVTQSFPLLLAIQEQQAIATGARLAAEGQFDLILRSSLNNNEGSFGNTRYDLMLEQATPFNGASFFAGYRLGLGDFPVYNLGQKTGEGGEYRAGFQVPLLRDGPIDRRRAVIRQAKIQEQLADPVIRRERINFLRAAARTYWAWVATGEQYRIAKTLYDTTDDLQKFLEKRLAEGAEDVVNIERNRQVLLERQGLVVSAERAYQRAAYELSLYHRDANGDPIIPASDRLPPNFVTTDPVAIGLATKEADVVAALEARPELDRFRLEKAAVAVDIQLAQNQFFPALNVGANVTQDTGFSKKSFIGTGIFGSDNTSANVFATFDLPLQRRGARGDVLRHQARLRQLLLNEEWTQNVIRNEVLDALADMDRAYERLQAARREQRVADTVLADEVTRLNGRVDVLAVNVRQFAAAQARVRVAGALADYYRAFADYQAALGRDGGIPRTEPAKPVKADEPKKDDKPKKDDPPKLPPLPEIPKP